MPSPTPGPNWSSFDPFGFFDLPGSQWTVPGGTIPDFCTPPFVPGNPWRARQLWSAGGGFNNGFFEHDMHLLTGFSRGGENRVEARLADLMSRYAGEFPQLRADEESLFLVHEWIEEVEGQYFRTGARGTDRLVLENIMRAHLRRELETRGTLTAAEIDARVTRFITRRRVELLLTELRREFPEVAWRPQNFPSFIARDYVPPAGGNAVAGWGYSWETYRFTGIANADEAWMMVADYDTRSRGYFQNRYLVHTANASYIVPAEYISLVPIGEGGIATSVPTAVEMESLNRARMAEARIRAWNQLGRAYGPRPTPPPQITFVRRMAGRSLRFALTAGNVLLYWEYLDWVVRQHPGGEEGLWVAIFGRGDDEPVVEVGPMRLREMLSFADGVTMTQGVSIPAGPGEVQFDFGSEVERTGATPESAIPVLPGRMICGTSSETEIFYEVPIQENGATFTLVSASGGGPEGVDMEIFWCIGFLNYLDTLSSGDIPAAQYTDTHMRGDGAVLRLVSTTAPFSYCFIVNEPGSAQCRTAQTLSVATRADATILNAGTRWWDIHTDEGMDDFCDSGDLASQFTACSGEMYLLASIASGTNPSVKLVQGPCEDATRSVAAPTARVTRTTSGCGSYTFATSGQIKVVVENETGSTLTSNWVVGYGPCPTITITSHSNNAILTGAEADLVALVQGRGVTSATWEYSVTGADTWTTIEQVDTSAQTTASYSTGTTWDISALDPGSYDLRVILGVQGISGDDDTILVIIPGDVTPGVDCDNAPTITSGITYGPFTVDAAESQWFKVAHAGGNYKVTAIVSANTGQGNLYTHTGTCESLVLDVNETINAPATYCGDSTQTAQDIFVQVSGGTQGVTYTISYGTGTC